jgi:REP element-mobilizing transposase RayT
MPVIAPGYFLTWHTYGTWLHGDSAGSVDNDHNRFGTPRLPASPMLFSASAHALKHPPLILSPIARTLVDNIMREHCRIRAWNLLALRVRSNHVHAVIGEPTVDPEPIVKQLKEWGTRKLRQHRIIGPRQHAWADHASTIYLYEPGSVEEKVHYVLHMQDDPPAGHGRPNR